MCALLVKFGSTGYMCISKRETKVIFKLRVFFNFSIPPPDRISLLVNCQFKEAVRININSPGAHDKF